MLVSILAGEKVEIVQMHGWELRVPAWFGERIAADDSTSERSYVQSS
jgi:hypothetical protein